MLQRYNVRVRILDELPHYLQLPILEPLVLQDLFDRYHLVRFNDLRLEDNPEAPVSDDPFRRVADVFRSLRLLLRPVRGRGGGSHGGHVGGGLGARRRRRVLVNAGAVGSARHKCALVVSAAAVVTRAVFPFVLFAGGRRCGAIALDRRGGRGLGGRGCFHRDCRGCCG